MSSFFSQRTFLFYVLFVFSVFALGAQTENDMGSDTRSDVDERLVIARGLSEYPVTVGDRYRVYLQRGGTTSQINFSIPGSYIVNLGPVGTFSAEGMTLEGLRQEVENLVSRAYPSSFPRFELVSIGLFRVRLTGAIPQSRIEQAWGLTPLSEIVRNVDASEASMRRVVVVSSDNRRRSYDLFLAQRGRSEEDPFVRPGDTVEFQPRLREVTVRGEVRFPGTYEALASDTLRDVIDSYAGGMTELAVRERVEIRRLTNDGNAQRVDYSDRGQRATKLEDRDVIVVRSQVETFPIVYLEGALEDEEGAGLKTEQTPDISEGADEGPNENVPRPESRIIRRTLLEGETLLDVLRSVEGRLHPEANLRDGLIRRRNSGRDVRVDMEALLYERQLELDQTLSANDRIIIPFGVFEVFITGEVTRSGYEEVRSLDRLSEVVEPYFTDYSSNRSVTVRSANDDEETFDLFRARRFGERGQNPYLQPGDTVIVERRDREVRITGQVERPGTYQLLPDEQLGTLIDSYAGGSTNLADIMRVSITSVNTELDRQDQSETVFESTEYDLRQIAPDTVVLKDLDTVSIPSRKDFLPAVFFEGAIRGTITSDEVVASGNANQSDQYRYQFRPGETVADAVRRVRDRFLTTANLRDAFLERGDTRIAIDVASMLYSDRIPPSPKLQRNDRIVIPFRQYFVTVSGAVSNPGQFPYIPDRGYEYYLGLAGGTDPQRHIGENPRIRDAEGNRKRDAAIIDPEDDIFFRSTNPIYHLSPILGVASTVLSTIAIFLSIAR